jgi:peptidoglycan-associated lipoprotein
MDAAPGPAGPPEIPAAECYDLRMKKITALLAVLVVVSACTPKKTVRKGSAAGADGRSSEDGGGPRLAYAKGEDMPEADIRETEFKPAGPEVKTIYFEYDQYGLSAEATEALHGNVAWLQRSGMKVLVEGHADERGTAEYNLALGQKRAKTVREYYVRAGVAPTQVGTISYGKERPDCTGDYDSCGPKNRRAVTLVAPGK